MSKQWLANDQLKLRSGVFNEVKSVNSQQDPSVAEQKFHRIVVLLQMFVELRDHHSNQLAQILQVPVDIVVGWRAHKDGSLHEANEAPEGLRLVLQLAEDGRQEITHTLGITNERGGEE